MFNRSGSGIDIQNFNCSGFPRNTRHTGSSLVSSATRWIVFFAVAIGLTLCSATAPNAVADERKALRDRATLFWEARVKADAKAAYAFLTEEEKAKISKEQFEKTFKDKSAFRYFRYKIGDVEVDDELGWVFTEYEAAPVRFEKLPPKQVKLWQVWEERDGEWFPLPRERKDQAPKLPPKLRPLKEEAAVIARTNTFWQAREKGDYGSIYPLCPPSFRAKISKEEFLEKRAKNIYLAHEVHWAEVEGEHATVKLTFSYRPDDPNLTKLDPSSETMLQKWIKVEGNWYLDIPSEG
jgi:hypothetical protein